MKRPALRNIVIWIGLILVSGNIFSQNPDWMYWDPWTCTIPSRFLSGIEVDANNNKWIGTEPVCGGGICTDGGLAVFDGYTWQVYDSLNSTLNSNFIGSVHIAANDVVWAGTKYGAVSSYDGSWEEHPFPASANVPVVSITSDLYGYIWAATEGNGLFMFDGGEWDHYNSGNSILPDYLNTVEAGPDNSIWAGGATDKLFKYTGEWASLDLPPEVYFISCISINHENSIWVGSEGVICNYFAGTWTVYDESITGIPDTAIGYIFDIEFDYSGNTWIGHSEGLIKYDGADWTTYAPENSGLLSRHIQSLAADELGNLWIGTADTGLIAYRPGGVVKTEERRSKNEERIVLNDPYPNPSSGSVYVQIQMTEREYIQLSACDIMGRIVFNVFEGIKSAGTHDFKLNLEVKGVYYAIMRSQDQVVTKKIILQ